jgi:hypothetical protein
MRWVLIRDPPGKFDPQALLCTKWEAAPWQVLAWCVRCAMVLLRVIPCFAAPWQVLAWCVRRWQVAVPFEEARAPLGMETQRPWSDTAVPRTPPWVRGL